MSEYMKKVELVWIFVLFLLVHVWYVYGADCEEWVGGEHSYSPGETCVYQDTGYICIREANAWTTPKDSYFFEVTDECVINDNNPPVDISLSDTEIREGVYRYAVVGFFSTADPDTSDTHTYSLISDSEFPDNSAFLIEGNRLRTDSVFNYSEKDTFKIKIRSLDSGADPESCTREFEIIILPGIDLTEWSYSKRIYFNTGISGVEISDTVKDVSVPVTISSSDLNFDEALSTGDDIRFITNDGVLLPHETEVWDSEDQEAVIWVNVPVLIPGREDYHITMQWGNSNAGSHERPEDLFYPYSGVWHLREDTGADTRKNSALNHYDSTNINTVNDSGIIGLGETFDGINDYISCYNALDASIDELTVSLWMKLDENQEEMDIISTGDSSHSSSGFGLKYYNNRLSFTINNGQRVSVESEDIFNTGEWYYVTATYSLDGLNLYVDGEEVSSVESTSNSILNTADTIYIGVSSGSGEMFYRGEMDEIRIKERAETPVKIKINYEVQKKEQGIYSIGSSVSGINAPTLFEGLVTDSGIVLSWQDNSENESGFLIYYGESSEDMYVIEEVAENTTAYIHDLTDCGVSGVYGISAFNSEEESRIILLDNSIYTDPCQPADVTFVSSSESQISISWDGSSSEYNVQYKSEGGNTWSDYYTGAEKLINHGGLECNTDYQYRIRSVNPVGAVSEWVYSESYSTDYCSITPPSNLIADNTQIGVVELSWEDNSGNEDGFNLFRKESGEAEYTQIGSTGENSTEYTDNGVSCGKEYTYFVQGYNENSVSGGSNSVEVNTHECWAMEETSEMITLSGVFPSSSDNSVDTTMDIVVKMYSQEEQVYTERFNDVQIRNGFFQVYPGRNGDVAGVIRNNKSIHYNLSSGGEDIYDTPRPLTGSPYSIKENSSLHGIGSPVGSVSAETGASYVDTENRLLYMKYGPSDTDWVLVGE